MSVADFLDDGHSASPRLPSVLTRDVPNARTLATIHVLSHPWYRLASIFGEGALWYYRKPDFWVYASDLGRHERRVIIATYAEYARQELNLQPLAPEANALSN